MNADLVRGLVTSSHEKEVFDVEGRRQVRTRAGRNMNGQPRRSDRAQVPKDDLLLIAISDDESIL